MAAKIMRESNEKMSRAEALFRVNCSDEWMQYNEDLANLWERVDILYAKMTYIKMCAWNETDKNANARAERRMLAR